MSNIIETLALETGRTAEQVENVVRLIDEGATIPFIARYRKELHGSMDDQLLRTLGDRLQYLRNLEQRKEEVRNLIDGQGKLTDQLTAQIQAAATLAELEDLYRPFRPKRRTRATVAREKGLAPLAAMLSARGGAPVDPEEAARAFVNEEKGVGSTEEALQGANDILAEDISDSAAVRKSLREMFLYRAVLRSKAVAEEPEDTVYRLYYDFEVPVKDAQGYQILAINRGEREKVLKVSVELNPEAAHMCVRRVVRGAACPEFVQAAADDAYDRLIEPSMEREIRNTLTEQANEGAIHMFALNLKPLLMQPPVKGRVTMGLDPGYRMGCKVAVVDGTGKVLDTAVVYPTHSNALREECIRKLSAMIREHHVEHIAIGNGTASRETEMMTVEMLHRLGGGVSYMIVSEAGASVYSASKLAAEEFPQFDVNLRSAVSIARRLQDPLAELVKIDPKAIGVGQYQHDMPQARLGQALDGVVEDCVNAVGVDANTASPSLLQRVSGLTATTAKNVVKYREENGPFTARGQLLKVPKLGPKTFEQCAGFLRVPESGLVLDNTGVHPESYPAAEKLLDACGYTMQDVSSGSLQGLKQKAEGIGYSRLSEICGAGEPTLADIVKELMKPGRDPRDELPPPILRTDVLEISDLQPGMELQGTVRNVVDFGAFVDIGVHRDGLVHSSGLPRRVRHPSELLAVGDVITVWVLEVDEAKNRISLTMRNPEDRKKEKEERQKPKEPRKPRKRRRTSDSV